jgi:hypothetical protein
MADDYERAEMPGIGAVLYRHKVSSPRWLMGLLTAFPAGIGAVGATAFMIADQPWIAAAMLGGGAVVAGATALMNVVFSSARIAVSEGEVHIQLGLAGPRIPIRGIADVEIAPSGVNKIGMGVGTDLRGTTYYRLWGDNRRAVHLTLNNGKRIVVVMKDPDAMARAVEAARSRDAAHAVPDVRVAEDASVTGPSESTAHEVAQVRGVGERESRR